MQMTPAAPAAAIPALRRRAVWRLGCGLALVAALGACGGEPLDMDLRGLSDGFSTTAAAQSAARRPEPDSRGVITYPNSQVVVAREGDTVQTIAARLGLEAGAVARYNGVAPDAPLRRDELIALPSRITGSAVTAPAPGAGGLDVASLAGAALDRAGTVTTQPLPAAAGAASGAASGAAPANGTPFGSAPAEPVRHQVARGETAYTIARLYNVPVADIAAWNGLGADLAVREGQQLLVPLTGGQPPAAATTTAPGAGSPTPVPPSASAPLPPPESPASAAPAAPAAAAPAAAAPDLGASQTAAPSSARFVMPASGAIIRAYAPGRNEGVDIGAAAGSEVRAADAGTVAAVTTNTEGIRIVVIRHADGLLTVYTHLDNLTVAKDSTVSRGQVIGRVRAGSPAYVHFEVRRGMSSEDPARYLP